MVDVAFHFRERGIIALVIEIIAFSLKTIISPLAFILKMMKIDKEIKKTVLALEKVKEQNKALS